MTPSEMGFTSIGGGTFEHPRFPRIVLYDNGPNNWQAWHDWPPFVSAKGLDAERAAVGLITALGDRSARCRRLARRLARAMGVCA